jgi:hypothetical protein
MNTDKLPPHLQKLVDLGESGTDILHGKLKDLMLQAEGDWILNRYKPEGKYHEGQLDAYAYVYELTYQLAFAIADRAKLTNQ